MANDTADWAQQLRQFNQTLTVGHLQGSNSATVSVPTGAAAVLLSVLTSGLTQLQVTGVQSGTVYVNQANPVIGPVGAFLYDVQDTSITISITHNATGVGDSVDISWVDARVVSIAQFLAAVDVSDRSARLLGQADVTDRAARAVGQVSPRPYDFSVQNTFTNGAATLTTPSPGVGKFIVVGAYKCRLLLTAAGTFANDLLISDGFSTYWRDGVAIASQDVADHAGESGLAIKSQNANTQMSLSSTVNPGATVVLSLAMAGWFD